MIQYNLLGPGKRLNEIIFAGSHDAGINTGGDNAKTQNLDILGQARAGVRFFDVRVAAFAAGTNQAGGKQVELKSFHADDMVHKQEKKTRTVLGGNAPQQVVRSKLRAGTEGLGLRQMLQQAKAFVESVDGINEFLILKFDKCTNWALIAQTCRDELGTAIYRDGGNLNTKTLAQLAGKVVCAFMPKGFAELGLGQGLGITPIVNLYKPPATYRDNLPGIQYWGAGGTNPFAVIGNKTEENIEKQSKILGKSTTGVRVDKWYQRKQFSTPASPDTLGMMYWTSTGLLESIEDRNNRMWDLENVGGLDTMWLKSFRQYGEYLDSVLPRNIDPSSYGSGNTLKAFMPNIVMVDFADEQKCGYIHGLNTVAATVLVKMTRKLHAKRGAGN